MIPIPWIPFAARDFLESQLRSDMEVFEWGSGGSTLWFARRVKHIVTVEHWGRYKDLLVNDIKVLELTNVDLRFVPPGAGRINAHPDVDHPDNYFGHPYDQAFDHHNFKTYVDQIIPFSDGYFDVVFIDGQARSACLKWGRSKVKPGGLLIFDNSDRKRHFKFTQNFFKVTGKDLEWEQYIFWGLGLDHGKTGLPWECMIWKRVR